MKFRDTYFKEVKDYASHTPEVGPEVLDCSQGVNPYGPTAAALGEAEPDTARIATPAMLFSRFVTAPIAVLIGIVAGIGLY